MKCSQNEHEIKQYLDSIPEQARNVAKKGFNGGLRAAINTKCKDCMGYELYSMRIRECEMITCPLHAVRPYQKVRKVKEMSSTYSSEPTHT